MTVLSLNYFRNACVPMSTECETDSTSQLQLENLCVLQQCDSNCSNFMFREEVMKGKEQIGTSRKILKQKKCNNLTATLVKEMNAIAKLRNKG